MPEPDDRPDFARQAPADAQVEANQHTPSADQADPVDESGVSTETLAAWVPEVATYADGARPLYATQYEQAGQLVDMWAELIEGYADRAGDFLKAYGVFMDNRQIPRTRRQFTRLTASGVFPPNRQVELVKREVVTIAVYFATQGNDLYVSWRAFVQGKISPVKVLLWILIVAVLTPKSAYGDSTDTFVIAMLVTAVLIGLVGFFRYQGDVLALLRASLNEFYVDDTLALSSAVHYSLIAAADKLGIDTTKFQPREPLYTFQGRKRRL